MSKIKKHDPVMALAQQVFGGVMKPPPQGLQQGTGFFTRKLQLWEMRDLAEASDCEARIAQNNASVAKAHLDLVSTMVTFPMQIEAAENRIKHEKKMFKHAQKSAKLDNQLKMLEVKRTASELTQLLKELKDGTDEA